VPATPRAVPLPFRAVPAPGGYPDLTLSPTVPLPARLPDAGRARRYVETFEHAHGNPCFAAPGLDRMPARTAHELASVYVALRETYPSVRPDRLRFGFRRVYHTGSLAEAVPYGRWFPDVRDAAAALDLPPAQARRGARDTVRATALTDPTLDPDATASLLAQLDRTSPAPIRRANDG